MLSVPDGCQRGYLQRNELWDCACVKAGIFHGSETTAAAADVAAQYRLLQPDTSLHHKTLSFNEETCSLLREIVF